MSVKRIKNLVKQLNEYRHAYYNQDAPLVSDAEYDRLFDELKELEEQLAELRHENALRRERERIMKQLEKETE